MNINEIDQVVLDNAVNGMYRLAPFKVSAMADASGKYAKSPAFKEWNGESDWKNYATRDLDELQRMLDKCDGKNIILQAVCDNCFFVEADMHKLDNGGGLATFTKWDEQFGYTPTFAVQTPTNKGQRRTYAKPSGTYTNETRLITPYDYEQVQTLVTAGVVWGKGYKTLDASPIAYRPDYLYGIVEVPVTQKENKQYENTPEEEILVAEACIKSLSRFRSDHRDEWIRVLQVLKGLQDEERAKKLAIEFSKRCRSKWEEEEYKFDDTWETMNEPHSITLGSLVFMAQEDDKNFVHPLASPSISKKEVEELNEELEEVMEDVDDAGLPELTKNLTDLGNAMRLIELSGDKWVWCEKQRKSCFRVWDGKKWADDEDNLMWAYVEDVIKLLYKEASEAKGKTKRAALAKHAKYSESAYSAKNTLFWAAKKHTSSEDDFDIDPELLNCNNGIINLRTGELLPHDPKYMCHRLAPIDYEPSAGIDSELVKFLKWEQDDDEPSMRFIQKTIGVGFSGRSPKAIPIVIGKGDSGKSGVFETLLAMAGTYGHKTNIEAFCKSDFGNDAGDKPNIYKVRLKGARFVVANEVREGMQLDNAQWKDLSGGDSLSTRGQHQTETTDFKPTHLIFIYGNYKPVVKDEDDAIWNRLCEIPFSKVIPVEQRLPDTDFVKDMYLKEVSAILNWIVQGYQMWLADGHLQKPERVVNATNEHRQSEDTFLTWLREEYEDGEGYTTYKAAMQGEYEEYVKSSKIRNVNTSQKYITRRMTELGYMLTGNGKNQYKGIRKIESSRTIGQPKSPSKHDDSTDDL